jgi:hypothetical protein
MPNHNSILNPLLPVGQIFILMSITCILPYWLHLILLFLWVLMTRGWFFLLLFWIPIVFQSTIFQPSPMKCANEFKERETCVAPPMEHIFPKLTEEDLLEYKTKGFVGTSDYN